MAPGKFSAFGAPASLFVSWLGGRPCKCIRYICNRHNTSRHRTECRNTTPTQHGASQRHYTNRHNTRTDRNTNSHNTQLKPLQPELLDYNTNRHRHEPQHNTPLCLRRRKTGSWGETSPSPFSVSGPLRRCSWAGSRISSTGASFS